MTVDAEILQTLAKMPKPLKTELLHYANYLIANYSEAKFEEDRSSKRHGLGSWAGQIVMSDDFDEPLEDMKDYM
jgi:hypothetical protein